MSENQQPLSEEDREEQLQQEKKRQREIWIKQLEAAPVVHEWTVKVSPFLSGILICIWSGVGLFIINTIIATHANSIVFFILGVISSIFMYLFTRYLWMANKTYHYQLTPIGIRYTKQDDIPEIAFSVARGIAWFGVIVCIFVAVTVGPLALVGAGGMALLSFGLTNFKSTIYKGHIAFSESCEIKTLNKYDVFSLISIPFHLIQSGEVYCEKNKLDETITKITPYLKTYTETSVKYPRNLY